MKIYILTSYDTGLNDPLVSFSYEDIYRKMEKSFHTALNGVSQTEDEKDNTSLDAFSATAVIHGDWIEWAITEVDIPLSGAFPLALTDEKSNTPKTQIKKMPENPYLLSYFLHKGLTPGDCYFAADYMTWIDKKHDEFRKLHKLPEFVTLNDAEVKEFVQFLNHDLENNSLEEFDYD